MAAETAAYDEIADSYESEFLRGTAARAKPGHPTRLGGLLRDLLGEGTGPCLEIGCGTGIHAAAVAAAGWTPVGVDLSAGMLRHARGRLPAAQADAARLPVREGAVPAALAVMVHTDMPHYPGVLREAARVLRPGGRLVHIGLHPCFFGAFADRDDPAAVVIRPGYRDGGWTARRDAGGEGVRARAGAAHLPLPDFVHAFLEAGLALERLAEHSEPTPTILAVRASKANAGGRLAR
jgi:SAM-dependent methyltransferase